MLIGRQLSQTGTHFELFNPRPVAGKYAEAAGCFIDPYISRKKEVSDIYFSQKKEKVVFDRV